MKEWERGEFWETFERMIASCQIVIDRPGGSAHPIHKDMIYPFDYGYLKGTSSMDGEGVDLWRGSMADAPLTGVICAVDPVKRDSEIKLLLGCTPQDSADILAFHNRSLHFRAILVPRSEKPAAPVAPSVDSAPPIPSAPNPAGIPGRPALNRLYSDLHRAGREVYGAVKEMGFPAALCWCNLHESLVENRYETEYFPLPEIEIRSAALQADLGVTLNGACWLELTRRKEAALRMDWPTLGSVLDFELYGVEDYRTDLYRLGMDIDGLPARIAASREEAFHLCFRLPCHDRDAVLSLLGQLIGFGLARDPMER